MEKPEVTTARIIAQLVRSDVFLLLPADFTRIVKLVLMDIHGKLQLW
jgi:hypothetical protein